MERGLRRPVSPCTSSGKKGHYREGVNIGRAWLVAPQIDNVCHVFVEHKPPQLLTAYIFTALQLYVDLKTRKQVCN